LQPPLWLAVLGAASSRRQPGRRNRPLDASRFNPQTLDIKEKIAEQELTFLEPE